MTEHEQNITNLLFRIIGEAEQNKNEILKRLSQIESKIMATQADLDAAIAALPAELETALEAAITPIIAAIQAKAPTVDFTSEIASLNGLAGVVAPAVATAVTPAS